MRKISLISLFVVLSLVLCSCTKGGGSSIVIGPPPADGGSSTGGDGGNTGGGGDGDETGGGGTQAEDPTADDTPVLCTDIGQTPIVLAYYTENSSELPDVTLLTHINYAHGRFGDPSEGDGGIWIEKPEKMEKVLALKSKNPKLKVMLMIGGWGDKANGFSKMARDPEKRTLFCTSVKGLLDQYHLDGVDIDWEYPGGGPSSNDKSDQDAYNFNLVLKELRQTIGTSKIISYASSATAGYVLWTGAMKYLDYVNVMTYDMGKPPYHNATLYRSGLTSNNSVEESVQKHLNKGVPLNRQVLGVPFYGHGKAPYADDVKYNEMAAILAATSGEYAGKNKERWDDVAKVPYLTDVTGSTMYLGYDNARSVGFKGEFAKDHGMLGAMCWEYRHDDSNQTLLKALVTAIYGKASVIKE